MNTKITIKDILEAQEEMRYMSPKTYAHIADPTPEEWAECHSREWDIKNAIENKEHKEEFTGMSMAQIESIHEHLRKHYIEMGRTDEMVSRITGEVLMMRGGIDSREWIEQNHNIQICKTSWFKKLIDRLFNRQ